MTTSIARIEANRRNAQHSTGPTSAAGKAKSRLNAFQHGLAGAGDLLAPGEHAELVAERTQAFAAEFGVSGAVGEFLARRAAVLSVRMDRADEEGEAELVGQVHAARAEFEDARVAELDRLVDLLTRPQAMHSARAELEGMPEGIDRLLGFWERQATLVESPPPYSMVREQAASLLGLTDEQAAAATPADLVARIEAERARLRAVDAATRDGHQAMLARIRDAVGRAARRDPSPQVLQIRRYDAAAERGFYRAVRAIEAMHRAQARASKPGPARGVEDEPAAPRVPVPSPSEPPPESRELDPVPVAVQPAAAEVAPVAPLGSFRPDIDVAAARPAPAVGAFDYARFRAELFPHERRDVRREVQKVKKKRR